MNDYYTNGTIDFDAAIARARRERSAEFHRIIKSVMQSFAKSRKADTNSLPVNGAKIGA